MVSKSPGTTRKEFLEGAYLQTTMAYYRIPAFTSKVPAVQHVPVEWEDDVELDHVQQHMVVGDGYYKVVIHLHFTDSIYILTTVHTITQRILDQKWTPECADHSIKPRALEVKSGSCKMLVSCSSKRRSENFFFGHKGMFLNETGYEPLPLPATLRGAEVFLRWIKLDYQCAQQIIGRHTSSDRRLLTTNIGLLLII